MHGFYLCIEASDDRMETGCDIRHNAAYTVRFFSFYRRYWIGYVASMYGDCSTEYDRVFGYLPEGKLV